MKTYILKNQELEVHVLDYGGIIDQIICADKDGNRKNVVLSYEQQQDYIDIPGPYLNTIVGPVAGRVSEGKDGRHQLSLNDGKNHLHGGFHGISFDTFKMEQISDTELKATLKRNHDADGYEGDFDYTIIYRLVDDKFILDYDVNCSKPNLLYLTCHLYFNLSGDLQRDIKDEKITAQFKQMMTIGKSGAPNKVVAIPSDSPFDFSKGKILGDVLASHHPQFELTRGIDHPFIMNGEVSLFDEISGRELTITSDAPCIVLYSANYIDETMTFKNGVKGKANLGLAMELQDYANGINLGLGKLTTSYRQTTTYRFTHKK